MEVNFNTREVNIKIVYYGPGLSGKTTNLEIIHSKTPDTNRGSLTAVATDQDRTLFFDYMPVELGEINGFKIRLRLFTVPGQVYYNSTRKLVLKSVDGVVFVADSQHHKREENFESLLNLKENLAEYSVYIEDIPLVIQLNKRDLPDIMSIEEMQQELAQTDETTFFPAVAFKGDGVFQSLRSIASKTLKAVEAQLTNRSKARVTKHDTKGTKRIGVLSQKKSPLGLGKKSPLSFPQKATEENSLSDSQRLKSPIAANQTLQRLESPLAGKLKRDSGLQSKVSDSQPLPPTESQKIKLSLSKNKLSFGNKRKLSPISPLGGGVTPSHGQPRFKNLFKGSLSNPGLAESKQKANEEDPNLEKFRKILNKE